MPQTRPSNASLAFCVADLAQRSRSALSVRRTSYLSTVLTDSNTIWILDIFRCFSHEQLRYPFPHRLVTNLNSCVMYCNTVILEWLFSHRFWQIHNCTELVQSLSNSANHSHCHSRLSVDAEIALWRMFAGQRSVKYLPAIATNQPNGTGQTMASRLAQFQLASLTT